MAAGRAIKLLAAPSPNTHTSAAAAHKRGWSAARGGCGGSSSVTTGAYAPAPPIGDRQQTLQLTPKLDSSACLLPRSRPPNSEERRRLTAVLVDRASCRRLRC